MYRMQELLALEDRPTCVFTPDDFSAVGAYHAVQEAGLRVPEDISIVGYDGIPVSQALYPKLTTLMQDTKQIGRKAAEELIALIETPKTTLIEKYLIMGKLLEGGSVLKLA
jgi:DNA-binding LacI/PurR family transcriptional regulator